VEKAVTTQFVPTLEDVAREANVSTATVSRCLNTPERVVEGTRLRVLDVVKKLGYSPNFGARALAAKRTNTIGAIIPTMENAIFARGIQAFQEELRDHGVTLLVASSSYKEEIEAEQIRTLTARGADGLLLIGHHRDKEIYRFLEKHSVSVLTAWVYDPDEPAISIGFDNKNAMKDLAMEVIAFGHRKIGLISAEQKGNDRSRYRIMGVREAMRENGIAPDSLRLIETPYSIESGAKAFTELMDDPDQPTVIMCGNDVLAVGAIRQAKQMGFQIPRDISITGFDDIELASVADPALTTVHVPHREMGKNAARMLVAMVKDGVQFKSTQLMTRICMRESLSNPPFHPTTSD
jgi:LacI family transcriptional regulator